MLYVVTYTRSRVYGPPAPAAGGGADCKSRKLVERVYPLAKFVQPVISQLNVEPRKNNLAGAQGENCHVCINI